MLHKIALFLLTSLILFAKVDLEVVGEHNGNYYTLDSRDVVFSGDNIKFQFSSNIGEKFEILYKTKDGTEQKLFSTYLEKEKIYNYPSENKYLKLDNQAGTEIFLLKSLGLTTQFKLNHLANTINFNQVAETLADTSTYKSLDKREYVDYSKMKSIARGEKEKTIWKMLQNATVIVKSSNGDKNSIGAGTIIENRKYVLTNLHVVEGDVNNVYVAFKPKLGNKPSKNSYYKVEVVKKDLLRDLALLKLNDSITENKQIQSLSFAKENSLEVGEDIFNMGHPIGYFYTPGSGMIKNISNEFNWGSHQASYVIQHSIPSSSGNSGGPLVNDKLELVGIGAFSNTKGQNLNFAISIIDIKYFLKEKQDNTNENITTNLDALNKYIIEAGYKKEKTLGYIKIAKLDLNKNGIVDALLFDTNNDGMWNLIKYDKDEDGIIEKVTNY